MPDRETATKTIVKEDQLQAIIERLADRFTVLDFILDFQKMFPESWRFLVERYGLYGSGTRYSALTYLSNRLSAFSRKKNQNVLVATPKGWVPKESRFLRRSTRDERKHFGSPWIVIFNKKLGHHDQPLPIDDMVEIDRVNMEPILDRLGIRFDPELRKRHLLAEIKNGATIIPVLTGKQLIAYLEYTKVSPDRAKIMSIQIHPTVRGLQRGMTVRRLLTGVYRCLDGDWPKVIEASIHESNQPSLQMSRKLGFRHVKGNDQRHMAEADGLAVRRQIMALLKNTID